MPMEPICGQCCRPTSSRRCARCGSGNVRELGPESPSIEWLACIGCQHVWARTLSDTPALSLATENAALASDRPRRAPVTLIRSPPRPSLGSPRIGLGSAWLAVLHWAESHVWSRQTTSD
jgi:hypothetical protein